MASVVYTIILLFGPIVLLRVYVSPPNLLNSKICHQTLSASSSSKELNSREVLVIQSAFVRFLVVAFVVAVLFARASQADDVISASCAGENQSTVPVVIIY